MAFFGFGKKKTAESCCSTTESSACQCGGACQSPSAHGRFLVLGACCQKSSDTFANVQKAVRELGFSDEVVNIGDDLEIARYGVMQTPALVIDKKVCAYGRLLSVAEATRLIEQSGIQR